MDLSRKYLSVIFYNEYMQSFTTRENVSGIKKKHLKERRGMFLREKKTILSIAQELCLGAVILKIFRHFLEK